MYSIIMANLGRYTSFRYRDLFISIEDHVVVICDKYWYSQQRYELSSLKGDK